MQADDHIALLTHIDEFKVAAVRLDGGAHEFDDAGDPFLERGGV